MSTSQYDSIICFNITNSVKVCICNTINKLQLLKKCNHFLPNSPRLIFISVTKKIKIRSCNYARRVLIFNYFMFSALNIILLHLF